MIYLQQETFSIEICTFHVGSLLHFPCLKDLDSFVDAVHVSVILLQHISFILQAGLISASHLEFLIRLHLPRILPIVSLQVNREISHNFGINPPGMPETHSLASAILLRV
jgi:hypothetical protein